ncbi:response regulator [Paenibacillus thermotolerans]|uniref:response regulator n=1 Tax=Paenibacillus thermotolerans TaxID=3027807 RepID=UPI002368DFAC|nr:MULTISPECIES: response regulator [unclassified Paenibacillus]
MDEIIEVLIVEDDARIAEIHRRFAGTLEGFKVIAVATTGSQAMEWLSVVKPHLVLLDVYLPDMSGLELVKYIRREQIDADVIMITAAAEADIVRGALHGGVFDFIMKPLTYDRFKSCLEQYRQSRQRLKGREPLTSEQIDMLWRSGKAESAQKEVYADAPKGIDPLTLERVLGFVTDFGKDGMTAESLSAKAGLSRSTSRRYLEYLVSQKKLVARLTYGSIGRPERRYVLAP